MDRLQVMRLFTRIGELGDLPLHARRLGRLRQVTCASAGYLAQHPAPTRLDELEAHWMVDYVSASTAKSLPLEFEVEGRIELRSLRSRLAVNNGGAYVAACAAGFGIVQVPDYHVREPLQQGRFVEILPAFPPPGLPVHALYPADRPLSARVRVSIDWLAERFGGEAAGR